MTIDDEMLMAFADGELDSIAAKRVERAIAIDPAMAERVAAHRSLRQQMSAAYPLDSQPDPLADMIRASTVIAMPVKARRAKPRWLEVVALAACLVAGVAVGTQWQNGSVISSNGSLTASGYLAGALETQLASASGDTHMLVSFRSKAGGYCRVFAGEAFDGIACKNAGSWELIRTQSSSARTGAAYRQAGSESPALMSAAQDLMTGDPLSVADEQKARASHWKSECQTPGDAPTYC